MPVAATNQVAVRLIEEATFGTTPTTPALKEIRYTSEALAITKENAVSEVIRSDRQRDFLAEVSAAAEGDVNIELAFGTGDNVDPGELDILLEAALHSEFIKSDSGDGDTTGALSLDTTAAVAGTHGGTITRGAGSFITDGIKIHDTVTLTGSATQDGDYRVQAVSALVVTVEEDIGDAPLAAETGSGDEVLNAPLNTIVVVAAARTFTRAAGDFTVDQFRVGQFVKTVGFTNAGNNGLFRIETIAALVLTMEAGFGDVGDLADEATGTGDERVFGNRVTNGTTLKSFTLEKEYQDVTQFQVFQGMRCSGLSLSITAGEIVTGTFGFMGKGQDTEATVLMASARTTLPTNGATEIDPDTTTQLNATSNVGTLYEGGASLSTGITSIALTIENNLRNINVVSEKFPTEVNAGFVDVSGTLEALFEDETLFNKFVNHTESALIFDWSDAAGNYIVAHLPRIHYGSGSPTTPGGNDEVGLSMEFTAIRESVTGGQTVQFDVLPASLP